MSVLLPGASVTPEGWVVYGDQAYLPAEWEHFVAARPDVPELAEQSRFTNRQRSILDLLASGEMAGTREVGERLGIADQTVKNHLRDIRARTGIPTTLQLVARYIRGTLPIDIDTASGGPTAITP